MLCFVSNVDHFLTHNYSLYDITGQPVMRLNRPAKFAKSTVNGMFPDGSPAGQIVQQNVFGKIRAENWRAWNFAIVDTQERERARITKKWAGLLKASFTTADNYLVDIDPSLDGAPSVHDLCLGRSRGHGAQTRRQVTRWPSSAEIPNDRNIRGPGESLNRPGNYGGSRA